MRELITSLPTTEKADYLLDTCYLIYEFKRGRKKDLEILCKKHHVGMSSFNLLELEHVTHKLPGPISRHIRDFLKQQLIFQMPVDVKPGERKKERDYVSNFDPKILNLVPDPSDAVLFVQAIKLRADILTRDRHHIFTAVADNYSDQYNIKVLNKI